MGLPSDEMTATIERIIDQAVAGRLAKNAAVAAITSAMRDRRAAVTTKEREAAEGERLLSRYDELVARGRGRNAAMLVARESGEPHEWETIADRIRRLRSRRAKRSS